MSEQKKKFPFQKEERVLTGTRGKNHVDKRDLNQGYGEDKLMEAHQKDTLSRTKVKSKSADGESFALGASMVDHVKGKSLVTKKYRDKV